MPTGEFTMMKGVNVLSDTIPLPPGGVAQFFTVGSQSFVVTGDDDKGLVVLWECFQVLHEFSYRLVRIACSGHIVIHFLWNGRREMNLFQFFRQFEGSMAGVGHQLHVNILPLLPDFPLLYFFGCIAPGRSRLRYVCACQRPLSVQSHDKQ